MWCSVWIGVSKQRHTHSPKTAPKFTHKNTNFPKNPPDRFPLRVLNPKLPDSAAQKHLELPFAPNLPISAHSKATLARGDKLSDSIARQSLAMLPEVGPVAALNSAPTTAARTPVPPPALLRLGQSSLETTQTPTLPSQSSPESAAR